MKLLVSNEKFGIPLGTYEIWGEDANGEKVILFPVSINGEEILPYIDKFRLAHFSSRGIVSLIN